MDVYPNQVHAIMGQPNSGKSAVVHAIAGHPFLDVADGNITWYGEDIGEMPANERTELGIYSCFQTIPEFESMTNFELFVNIVHDSIDSMEEAMEKYAMCCELLGLPSDHGIRSASIVGMTDSQQKRNELIYMMFSNPQLVVLDEIDTNMTDADIELVGNTIKQFISKHNRSCVVVSNNKKFLDILQPTHVHVMVDGVITQSGDADLYKRIQDDDNSEAL
ncbi:iron-sulfur cluster assembly protein SufC-like [Procambarus clarkii]|uniref:iron-sulfur cluster assembly protein SufC-like n=1 Tax=Procambarus clarkii TaxID=6728 RepID=UPI0037429CF8